MLFVPLDANHIVIRYAKAVQTISTDAAFHQHSGPDLYDKTNWLPDPQFRSGLTIAVTDFNGDHYPDLLRMRNGKSLEVGLMVPGDTVFVSYSTGVAHPSPAWCLVVGDVNNDGFKDIVTGGNSDQIILWKMGRDGQVIEKTILPESNIYVQAANFVDINNDGWLDLFVCNDDGISRIYGNDGQGNLQPQTGWLNLQTTIPSDNSGNYGSIWTDFDQDGDLDLYISKCKGAAQLPTDPRRINQLFVNYGPQGFKEEGVQRGLALGTNRGSVILVMWIMMVTWIASFLTMIRSQGL